MPLLPGVIPSRSPQWPSSTLLFQAGFLKEKANVIFLSTVRLGKTHLATALGYAACQEGHSVLFANAINLSNDLCCG
jgi:DNA replication protein DnaC